MGRRAPVRRGGASVRPRALWLLAILLGLARAGAQAHEVRPAISSCSRPARRPGTCSGRCRRAVTCSSPSRQPGPTIATSRAPPRRFATGGAATERSAIRCAGGLTGRAIAVSGLSATVVDVLARVQRSDGTTQVVRLTPSAPAFVVEDAPRGAPSRRPISASGWSTSCSGSTICCSCSRCCCWCVPGVAWSPPSPRSLSLTASRSPWPPSASSTCRRSRSRPRSRSASSSWRRRSSMAAWVGRG